jgi:hypothetical protein
MLLTEILEKITNEKLKEHLLLFKKTGVPFENVSVNTAIDLYCYLLDTMNKSGAVLDIDGDETSCLLSYGYSLIANLLNELSKGTIALSAGTPLNKYCVFQKTENEDILKAEFVDRLDAMEYRDMKNTIAKQAGYKDKYYISESKWEE